MYRGTVTVRKVATLATYLPAGAMVHEVRLSDASLTTDQMIARRQLLAIEQIGHGLAGGKGPEPEPWPLPSELAAELDQRLKAAERTEQARNRHIARMRQRQAQRQTEEAGNGD
jgi:hypothetical protein